VVLSKSNRTILRAGKIACFGITSGNNGPPSSDDVAEPPPKVPLAGQFKNPIVQRLWAAREDAKSRLGYSGDRGEGTSVTPVSRAAAAIIHEGHVEATPPNLPKSKAPRESMTEISYPLSTDEFLLESYRNPWGQMRFGKILEDLDALAGNIAFNHVEGNPLIVTAAVDRIRLRKRPLVDADQHLSGKVTWVGNSSMEIRMSCAEISTSEEWLEAFFTFVTLDPNTKKPINVPHLILETSEERASFELGAVKAAAKKAARTNKLQIGKPLTEAAMALDLQAAQLLDEAGPLLRMPSLADPTTILMRETTLQNALIAHPQVRNLHDRIFGGFLMRRAFELAFSTAYVFGGARPHFLEVDDISFDSPVDVGDLLVFQSRVLYTIPDGGYLGDYVADHKGLSLIIVEVECWVTIPEQASARVSNHFYFTFCLPKGAKCRRVLPENIDQARRMATRMAADQAQALL
jgi:acyl-coenzyme A thioesterase 9